MDKQSAAEGGGAMDLVAEAMPLEGTGTDIAGERPRPPTDVAASPRTPETCL
ncbi:hypothetical protein Acsp06_34230 [Actinomycetospora sp. NBRC 106375]|nr:hypothetical protein Acsp06_34230 [Actinomycetospora sp. NBRC 106375]